MVGVVANDAAVADRYSSGVAKIGHRLCHGRHHVVVVPTHVHVGIDVVRSEKVLVDTEAVGREDRTRRRAFKRDSHIHGCVGLAVREVVLVLVGIQFDGVKVTECICAWGSSSKRTVGHTVLDG